MTKTHEIGTVHTTVCNIEGMTSVVYHATAVVRFDDTKIILDTGGYQTVTTKRRMNQAANALGLGFRVFQVRNRWEVHYQGKIYPYLGNKITLDRYTGEVYTAAGDVAPMGDSHISA